MIRQPWLTVLSRSFKILNKAKMMADQARSNIEKYFSAELMLKKTLEIYEQYSCR